MNALLKGVWIAAPIGLAVAAGLALWGDAGHVLGALAAFPLPLFGLVLACTLWNYAFRWLKWQIYLRALGLGSLQRTDSLLVFGSGLALGLTPARAGEVGKGVWLRQLLGAERAPFARTAPIVLAERVTDGLALLLFAAAGLISFRFGMAPLLVAGGLFVLLVVVVQLQSLIYAGLDLVARVPRMTGAVGTMRVAYGSAYTLLRWRVLVPTLALSVVSWAGECVALFLVLLGLGAVASPGLFGQASFALAAASLIGSVSVLPGGLVAAEGTVAGILQNLAGQPRDVAAAATLLIRVSTLWFGVALGLVALTVLSGRAERSRRLAPVPSLIAEKESVA
jgi:uncharacterized protein (TIRG00374 family)